MVTLTAAVPLVIKRHDVVRADPMKYENTASYPVCDETLLEQSEEESRPHSEPLKRLRERLERKGEDRSNRADLT